MVFRIKYGDGTWYGAGWRPYADKRSAVKMGSRDAAEGRLANLRRIFAANPSWRQSLINEAVIVESAS